MTDNVRKPDADLGVKIGTKEELAWQKILEQSLEQIDISKRELLIQENIVELARKRIKEEQRKV